MAPVFAWSLGFATMGLLIYMLYLGIDAIFDVEHPRWRNYLYSAIFVAYSLLSYYLLLWHWLVDPHRSLSTLIFVTAVGVAGFLVGQMLDCLISVCNEPDEEEELVFVPQTVAVEERVRTA